MATVIRFSRHGTKKKPFYRIVVQDHRSPRDGKFIENVGVFNPIKGETTLSVKRDRLEYWLSVGAQMSDSVRSTLKPQLKLWKSGGEAAAPKASEAPPAKKKPTKAKEAAK